MINVRMTGSGAEQEMRSFFGWLQNEADVREHAQVQLATTEPQPNEMGTALEVIKLVTDSSFQTMNLALAYATWRATRPERPQVTIERNGIKVQLDDADDDAVGKIVRALR